LNEYIIIEGSDYKNMFFIEAKFWVICNDTRHYLFYTEDQHKPIISLNYYKWTIIGENGEIRMNPFDYVEV